MATATTLIIPELLKTMIKQDPNKPQKPIFENLDDLTIKEKALQDIIEKVPSAHFRRGIRMFNRDSKYFAILKDSSMVGSKQAETEEVNLIGDKKESIVRKTACPLFLQWENILSKITFVIGCYYDFYVDKRDTAFCTYKMKVFLLKSF